MLVAEQKDVKWASGHAAGASAAVVGNDAGDAKVAEVNWPKKYEVFGVGISATTYDQALEPIMAAAQQRRSATVTHMSAHGLTMAGRSREFRDVMNDFDIVAPDGQPCRWVVNKFHKQNLPDRCYGPELMIRLCRAAAQRGVSIYLYGSSPEVLELLQANLRKECPGLVIAGVESPPFRKLSAEETGQAIARINQSGAGLVFIGLGCPRQDYFAREHKHAIQGVQMCVGAAFDFHAGNKKMAPRWMQRSGLEWFFRLTQEPGRLWRRYLVIHTTFAFLLTRRMIFGR